MAVLLLYIRLDVMFGFIGLINFYFGDSYCSFLMSFIDTLRYDEIIALILCVFLRF